MQVAEDEDRETEDDLDEEDEEYDSGGSGVAMTPPGACPNILSDPDHAVNVQNILAHQCLWPSSQFLFAPQEEILVAS